MATYTRREVTHTRVEFVVPAAPPWGAYWAEVSKAIDAVINELRDTGRLGECESPSDDTIRFRPTDDALVVFYEFEVAS